MEEVACDFASYISKLYPDAIAKHYNIPIETEPDYHTLQEIAIARKCLVSGGEPDIAKAARMLLDDYRAGRLGRLSLERPIVDEEE